MWLRVGMDAVAHAISDPVRREILEAVSTRSRSAGELAEMFPITRPAVSRHLRVLRESGLVSDQVTGRHRLYAIEAAPLAPLVAWIASLDRTDAWQQSLDALDTEVRRTSRDRRRHLSTSTAKQEDSA